MKQDPFGLFWSLISSLLARDNRQPGSISLSQWMDRLIPVTGSEGFLFLTRLSSTQEASTVLHHWMSSSLLTLEIQYVGHLGEGRPLTAGMLAMVSTEIMQVWGRTALALLLFFDTFSLNKHCFLLYHVSLAVCILTIVRNLSFIFRDSSPSTFTCTMKQMVLLQVYSNAPCSHLTKLTSIYNQTDVALDVWSK